MKNLILGPLALLIVTSCVAKKPQAPLIKSAATVNPAVKNSFFEVVDFEKEFLRRINKARSEGCKCGDTYMPPVEPLIWNNELQLSALGHAQDMARNKYFSHVSKNGDRIKDRITSAGYTYEGFQSFTIGENIAFNQRSIREVMQGWLNSPSHCKNLMSPAFKDVGIAMQNYYWVQDFGGRIPFSRRFSR
ncbi:CAP domain-containing protein [Pedobacter sp. P351]|uniref:CAP domain-containing protein n=1 Tax=Pedobacter superstes TaxID=3133441 RepID=UPI0030A7D86C